MTDDDGKADYLNELLASKRLTGAAAGIARQAIGRGENSLSASQTAVFDKEIRKPFFDKICKTCGCGIEWHEMLDSLDNGGFCKSCWHRSQKDD